MTNEAPSFPLFRFAFAMVRPSESLAMPSLIQIHDRVYQPDMPERGYGVVRLIEENVLTDERTCQVQFEWVPRLVAVSERGSWKRC